MVAVNTQTLYLLRHGHRQDAADKDWRRISDRPFDPPLSTKGWQQAHAAGVQIAEKLQGMPGNEITVLSSPFLRCVQTAEIVCGLTDTVFFIEPGLCERLHPRFIYGDSVSFLPEAEIARHYPHYAAEEHKPILQPWPPESRGQVRRRSREVIRKICQEYGGPWILIGHGFTMKDIGCEFRLPGKLPKCGELRMAEVEIEDQQWSA
jgi:broad specificity phosphatase PhoE